MKELITHQLHSEILFELSFDELLLFYDYSQKQSADIKFWLIVYIVLGIIWLLFSYLLDYFILLATQKYITDKQKEFITYRNKIQKFLF
jgi:hypothetical protein